MDVILLHYWNAIALARVEGAFSSPALFLAADRSLVQKVLISRVNMLKNAESAWLAQFNFALIFQSKLITALINHGRSRSPTTTRYYHPYSRFFLSLKLLVWKQSIKLPAHKSVQAILIIYRPLIKESVNPVPVK